MADLLSRVRRLNGLGGRSVAEPFCGGAGASLTLLYLEEAHAIHVNDADPSIFDFWWSITQRSKAFLDGLAAKRVSMAEWRRQRGVYRKSSGVSRLRRGFAAFYLNRCNRSGIIMNGGPIGGVDQTGKWKLGARFNKAELRRRLERVAEYRDRIHVSGDDGIEFIDRMNVETAFLFVDPPYFHKGETLYMNTLDATYHASLADRLRQMAHGAWALTYDDCPEVRRMYRGWATIRPFSLRYVAAERRGGREILIVPKWMRLPKVQSSDAIHW